MVDTETEAEERFETNQTVVAAYFHYNGLKIVEMVWLHGTCTFFFENSPELHALFSTFVQGKALVEPQGFNNAYGEVKTQMFKIRDATRPEDR